tara:strand:- start:11007 stop:11147 length:141 start_codon:yes stop_codon:yes gene_type:complete
MACWGSGRVDEKVLSLLMYKDGKYIPRPEKLESRVHGGSAKHGYVD